MRENRLFRGPKSKIFIKDDSGDYVAHSHTTNKNGRFKAVVKVFIMSHCHYKRGKHDTQGDMFANHCYKLAMDKIECNLKQLPELPE